MGKQRTRFEQIQGQGGGRFQNIIASKNYQENIAKNYVKEQKDLEAELLLEQIEKEEIQKQLLLEQKLKEEAEKYTPQTGTAKLLADEMGESQYREMVDNEEKLKPLENRTLSGRYNNIVEHEKFMAKLGINLPGKLSYVPKANFAKEWDGTDEPSQMFPIAAQGVLNFLGGIYNRAADASIYIGSLVPAITEKVVDKRLTDKEEVELELLRNKHKTLTIPALTKIKNEVKLKKDIAIKNLENLKKDKFQGAKYTGNIFNTKEEDIINHYQEIEDEYENAIEDEGYLPGFYSDIIPTLDVVRQVRGMGIYEELKEKGIENISETDKEWIQSYELLNETKTNTPNSNGMYKFGKNIRGSADFIVELFGAKGVGKVVGAIGKGVGITSKLGTTGNLIASEAVKPLVMGSMYKNALEDNLVHNFDAAETGVIFNKETGELENIPAITDLQKEKLSNQYKRDMSFLSMKFNTLRKKQNKTEKEEEELKDISNKLFILSNSYNQIFDEKGEIRKKEKSLLDSSLNSYTSTLADNIAETIGGKFIDKGFSKLGKDLNKIVPKKLQLGIDKLNKGYAGLLDEINTKFDSNGLGKISKNIYKNIGNAKIINELPTEVAEEYLTNMIPVYGEDYAQRVSQNLDPHFFWEVISSSAVIGGKAATLGLASKGRKHASGMYLGSKEDKEKYRKMLSNKKELTSFLRAKFRAIDNTITDDDVAKQIAMNTLGSIYDENQYQIQINNLRNPEKNTTGESQEERNTKADQLEKNSFINTVLRAIETGTDKDFRNVLSRLTRNKNISQETKTNAELAIKKLDTYKDIMVKNQGLINSGAVTQLEINKDMFDTTISNLQKYQEKNKPSILLAIDEYNKTATTPISIDMLDNIDNLEDEEINNNVANFVKKFESNPVISNYIENNFNLISGETLVKHIKEKLEYELNPINKKEIEQREKDRLKQRLVKDITIDNVEESKQKLAENNLENPEVIQEVNNKAIQSTDNIVPTIIQQTEPTIELSPEFSKVMSIDGLQSSGADVSDFGEITAEEKAVLKNIQGFPSPIKRDIENSNQNDKIQHAEKQFKEVLDKNPSVTFKGITGRLLNDYGADKLDHNFNLLAEAWNNVAIDKVSNSDIKAIYENLFGSQDIDLSNIMLGQTQESNPGVDTKAIEESFIPKIEKINPITEVVEKVKIISRKFARVGLKAGFLGLNYNEVDGKKETNSTDVNLNALHFIDPRNFNTGDEVELVFQYDYLLNPENNITVWNDIDDNPKKQTIKVKDFMERLFPGKSYKELSILLQTNPQELLKNENFLKSIPVGIKNNGQFNTDDEVITGGLNDYFWMNKSNLALIDDNVAEQEVRVQENRRINLETRKQILNNKSLILKVNEKLPGQHNTLLKDGENVSKEFQSIYDAHKIKEGTSQEEYQKEIKNKTAIGVIQNKSINKSDNTPITVNGKEVKTDSIINYNEFLQDIEKRNDKAEGKIVYVVQSGTNSKGEPLYIIHNVINNHEAKSNSFKNQMEILFQISKYRKILDGTEKNYTVAELEKAEKIRDNIKNKFGLNISNADVVNKLFSFYPEKSESSNPGENKFRQDYKPRVASLSIAKEGIPNLLKYNSINEFETDFIKGNIESITYDDIIYNNLHTNFIYTPVTNTKGETVWTSEVQPIITYTTNHIQDIKQEDNVDINKEKEILKKQIEFQETKILPELEGEDKKQTQEEINELKEKLNELNNVETTSTTQTEIEEQKEFTDTDVAQVVENLVYTALGSMDMTQSITKQNIYNNIVKEYNKLIDKFRTEGKTQEVKFIEDKKDDILGIGIYDNSVREIIDVLLKLDTNEEINESDLTGENIKDVNKESYEQTMSLSTKVKILLSGLKASNSNNNENFGGLDTLMSLGDAIYSLQNLMSELENNTLEDLKKLITSKVELNKNEFNFYNQLLERLENIEKIDSSILNQILYNLYQPKVKMSFVLFNQSKDGSYKMEVMDANSKNPLFIKRAAWNESFKNSPLIDKYNEGFFKLNQEGLKKYETLFDELQKTPSIKALDNYLKFLGIKLNEKLLEDTFDEGAVNNKLYNNLLFNTKGVINNINNNINKFKQLELLNSNIMELNQINYNKIVNKIFNTKEFLTDKKLIEELDKVKTETPGIVKKLELAFSNNVVEDKFTQRAITPLTFDNSVINDLIHADNSLSFIPGNMMYLGGKMINIFEQPKSITNTLKSLKSNTNNLMNDLLNSQITQDNFVLNLIKDNPELKNYIDVIMVGLEALKQRGDVSSDKNSITKLSSKDAFITLFNMFASSEGAFKNEKLNNLGIQLRKGLIGFPTISDSSQLPLFKTILLDIQRSNIINDNLDEDTMNLMISHLVKGDLLRAGAFLKNGTTTNIKGYDAGAVHITGVPSLNTIAVDFEYTKANGEVVQTKRTLIEVFRNNPEYHTAEGVNDFIKKYKEDITKEINRNIQHEVNQFINEDGTDGFFIKNDIYKNDKLSFIDDNYLSTKKDAKGLEQARLIAFDYVINNFIQQKEIQTVFAGDVANYFKDNMVKDMVNGRSVTTTENIIDYYYKNNKQKINKLIKEKDFTTLFNLFPQLKYSNEFITYDISHEEQYQEAMIPTSQIKMKKVFEDVSNNLSKRLKEILSPGNQFPNSKGNRIYKQIMLQDVENSSEVLDHLIKLNHPEKYEDIIDDVRRFKILDNIYENNRNALQSKEHEKLFNKLKNELPKITGFLKTASTDAQEYVSWKDNLNQLLDQGRLMEDEYQHLVAKLNQQEKDLDELGYIKNENKLTDKENRMAIMQPSKPLYSGQHFVDFGELKAQRYVYIKSSSFAITPEMAAFFPKLNYLRKAINNLQKGSENITVRISYDSANKVGAVKNALPISELYKDKLDINKLNSSTIELDRKNFYIQQDKPFEGNKYGDAGKDMQKTRATQFEKIILGDGINKITEKIFPNMFDSELLTEAEIELSEDNKINGVDLDKLYKLFYKKEQKMVKDKLFRELGIENYKDIDSKNYKVVENLVGLVNKRLSNKQDKRFLELVYTVKEKEYVGRKFTAKEIEDKGLTKNTAEPKVPLFMTPNSRKFESVFGSIINNNSVNLKLPGGASPVASQQNFDFKGFDDYDLAKLKKQGLVTTPNFDPTIGLKATTNENGELRYAQVFLPNRLRVYNEETGKNDLINLKEFTNEEGQIDFDKIPKDLLSMFSFRIPTSSHQSGVVIEVVGFLPDNMGDLMIVPKDHTVQIGEDYDIDTRYFYNYHYIKTADGKLKKLDYSDIPNLDNSLTELKKELEQYKKQLFEDYYNINTSVDKPLGNFKFIKNNHWLNNRETLLNIAVLQNSLENYNEDKVLHAIFQEQYDFEPIASKEEMQNKIDELLSSLIPKDIVSQRSRDLKNEYYDVLNQLKEAYRNEKTGLRNSYIKYGGALKAEKDRKRVLENNIISIYKSVFSSSDNKVQDLINKTLSTDFAEGTASYMNNKLVDGKDNIFNIYSASTQAKIMMLGADGKTGIGRHSNFVTQNSLLQQFANIDSNNNSDIQFVKFYDKESGLPVFYDIKLGTMTFDGQLGKVFSNNGFRISESAMESQNSATDNQKLGIMGRRNENAETINVFAILQASGLDNEGVIVDGKNLSYASMFINQPIIREYVELMKKNNSLTAQNKIDALQVIKKKYFKSVPKESWAKSKNGKPIEGKFSDKMKNILGKGLTSQKLADGLLSVDYDVETQLYVLDVFKQLEKPAREYNRLQKFINIENGGVGVSYFDTIELMDEMIFIASGGVDITRSAEMIGDLKSTSDKELIKKLESEGYIYLKEENGFTFLVKPSTHYGHKIVNSIANSYNLWKSIFPYENKIINDQIQTILDNTPDLSKDAIKELKYKIISELKDYILSDNKTLFGRNSKTHSKKLFFDTDKNTSLSKYLLELTKNKEYNYLFKLPFFKHLQFEMGTDEFPSLIKYNSNDITEISILNIYNTLNRLVNSDKQLLPKDGKNYTEADLMKDLLMYSMIGSQENGAIGFRHLLPVELFDKYNVPLTIRNKTGNEGEVIQSKIYNGIVKSMENYLGSKIDENGSIINNGYNISIIKDLVERINYSLNEKYATIDKEYATSNDNGDVTFNNATGDKSNSTFVEQYFQHNPDLLITIDYNTETIPGDKDSGLLKIIKSNGFTVEDFDNGLMTEFNSTIYDEDFLTIKSKNGKKLLYKKISDSSFKQIPILGTFGMNEYNSGTVVNKSLIAKNNPKNQFQHLLNLDNNNDIMTTKKLQQVLNGFIKNTGPYSDLLKILSPHVDFKNTKLIVDSTIVGSAEYQPDTNTIAINPKLLNDRNTTSKKFQHIMVEELLHHITYSTMKKYVKFEANPIDENGRLKYEFAPNTPSALRTLMMVYQQGIDVIVKEQGIETVLSKIKNFSDIITNNTANSLAVNNESEMDLYRITNIHEFIAGIFIKDSNFAKKMADTPYLNSGKSILDKFVELLGRMFDSILPGAKKDSISVQTLASLHEFLIGESNLPSTMKPYYESQYNNEQDNKVMNEAQNLLDEENNVNETITLDENLPSLEQKIDNNKKC